MDNLKLDIDLKNLSETEKENLLALVEKASKKPAPYFIPQKGETYWFVDGDGNVSVRENYEIEADKFRVSIGNCFRTRDEAREARMRMKMQTKWKRLSLEAGEADNPWDGQHAHWEVSHDMCSKEIYYYKFSEVNDGNIFFPSENSIKAAVKELGEQNVIDYIIGDKGALS